MQKKERLEAALASARDFYRQNGRTLPWRRDNDPYHVFLSEIMLQQTRVEAVKAYYEKFLSLFPTVEALADADEEILFKAWEGLGYYSRARNLKRAAERVVNVYGGVFPDTFDELLTLPGVGKYTAGAIASISFGRPKSAVDGNAIRIYSRLFADASNAADEGFKASVSEAFDEAYPSGKDAADTTQGLMEVGQRFCIPNGAPKCEGCPLASCCRVYKEGGDYRLFPNKEKKKPRRILPRTVLLLTDGEGFYIRKRENKGLLAGLWEFPATDGHLSPEEAVEVARALGFSADGAIEACTGKHIFTHLEWHMISYVLPSRPIESVSLIRATVDEMKEKYAIPSAFRAFLDYIKENEK